MSEQTTSSTSPCWLLGVDLQPGTRELIEQAGALADAANRALVVCAVLSSQSTDLDENVSDAQLSEVSAQYGFVRETIVRRGDITEELLLCASEVQAEVIVVGRRHRPLQHTLYRGRSIGELVAAVDRPLLVIPLGKDAS